LKIKEITPQNHTNSHLSEEGTSMERTTIKSKIFLHTTENITIRLDLMWERGIEMKNPKRGVREKLVRKKETPHLSGAGKDAGGIYGEKKNNRNKKSEGLEQDP